MYVSYWKQKLISDGCNDPEEGAGWMRRSEPVIDIQTWVNYGLSANIVRNLDDRGEYG